MLYESSIDLIGNTPMFKLNNMQEENMADVYVKLEKFNPGGSIKDRAALGMIEEAEKMGKIKPGDIIVEPTSGNTGIGLAMVGRLKGYKVIIVMPDSMSIERRNMIKAYGAELVLTEGNKGMTGAIEKAEELARDKKGYFIPQQFSNRANSKKHYETTAVEILKDVEDLDAFVASVGTGGTIAGIGRRLKEFNKNIKVVAVEPYNSPVISGGKAAPHKIQGIGAGFIPDVYEKDVVDDVMTITDEESYEYARRFGAEEGILVGISSGANIAAAIKIAKKLGKGKKVVTVAPDGGEKYISTGLYDK
ncbi:cysteine synthase A [Clostridium botulinum]|uniref:Cysteine synthase n=1 Tax=Clostridium botulinum (strain Kyoto / Type A2) TaxID=536232 RepID=C1FQU1_CLOBJ|nr:cysteine synthase A [Clostridium botulinum]ACO84666.1 cysteine synthase A [Clostridium botulinum A2 str. Kyoto]APH24306.1 cysteine synthase A [Clostridium botulinum]APQ71014.1 cysteine synthase A [Clostridium botulinum]APQ75648.1 cysteine synthase A [Clostridium botulinum]AUM97715.1 cysteine synthase A [Clostridium botulinum]